MSLALTGDLGPEMVAIRDALAEENLLSSSQVEEGIARAVIERGTPMGADPREWTQLLVSQLPTTGFTSGAYTMGAARVLRDHIRTFIGHS